MCGALWNSISLVVSIETASTSVGEQPSPRFAYATLGTPSIRRLDPVGMGHMRIAAAVPRGINCVFLHLPHPHPAYYSGPADEKENEHLWS